MSPPPEVAARQTPKTEKVLLDYINILEHNATVQATVAAQRLLVSQGFPSLPFCSTHAPWYIFLHYLCIVPAVSFRHYSA